MFRHGQRILMLFEDPVKGGLSWRRETESFYNPKTTKIEVTIVRVCLTSYTARECGPTKSGMKKKVISIISKQQMSP